MPQKETQRFNRERGKIVDISNPSLEWATRHHSKNHRCWVAVDCPLRPDGKVASIVYPGE